MAIKIPRAPAYEALAQRKTSPCHPGEHQDIRPLPIAIVNLMPTTGETESAARLSATPAPGTSPSSAWEHESRNAPEGTWRLQRDL
jgi:homoserine O-succinyltransferase